MADLKKFAEELVNLSVKEVNELAKILKEEYGSNRQQQQCSCRPAASAEEPRLRKKPNSTLSSRQPEAEITDRKTG
jgi:ribosomal protein L7/L12